MRGLPLVFVGCGDEPVPPPPPVQEPPIVAEEPVRTVHKGAAPRVVSVAFSPERPTARDDLAAVVKVEDPDGPRVDVDFRWFVNDRELLHRKRDNLPSSEVKKGDRVRFEFVASDGTSETIGKSQELIIANRPPFFLKDPRAMTAIDGYKVTAEDPDGDPLRYSLAGEPAGMTIDPASGVLHYVGSADEKGGDYQVTVRVLDDEKAFAEWKFGLSVSPGSKAR